MGSDANGKAYLQDSMAQLATQRQTNQQLARFAHHATMFEAVAL